MIGSSGKLCPCSCTKGSVLLFSWAAAAAAAERMLLVRMCLIVVCKCSYILYNMCVCVYAGIVFAVYVWV